MEKVKYRYNRWRLALGRLVNLRYINRWIIFCADLFISLCVSLIGVLGYQLTCYAKYLPVP